MCFGALDRYSLVSGAMRLPKDGAADWLRAHQRDGRPLLALVTHPLCPCTDASVAELRDFLVRSRGGCDAIIIQVAAAPAFNSAEPGVMEFGGSRLTTLHDPDGAVAALLGAETSGHAVFMDASGEIRFHGGLTIARGHRGESPAQQALLAMVQNTPTTVCVAPVYGCPLADPNQGGGTR